MIQGGGFTQDMKEKPTGAPIKNEANNGLSNAVGTIAMARTNDPNSATAQFFINRKTTPAVSTHAPDRPATPSSARSSTAWTWSTRSPR